MYIFSDNRAVVDVLQKERPKYQNMLELLQEFLYIVCTRKFTPAFRKINTKDNHVADFISRCHDRVKITNYFRDKGHPSRDLIPAPDTLFTLRSNW